ncbi:MAG: helix-turn-helix transcriptional regulator [Ilumatobacteraceae bacterium]
MDAKDRGRELARLRTSAGLLLRHVGAEFDIDKSAVQSWEAGKTSPDHRKLVKLDRLYGGRGEVLALFGFRSDDLVERVTKLEAEVRRLARALGQAQELEVEPDGSGVAGQRTDGTGAER